MPRSTRRRRWRQLAARPANRRVRARFHRRILRACAAERCRRAQRRRTVRRRARAVAFRGRRRPGEARVRVYNPGAGDGWSSPHTIVEIVDDDMPFLVDSVTAAINESGREVRLGIHPILSVARDAGGDRRARSSRAAGCANRGCRSRSPASPSRPSARRWPAGSRRCSPMSAPRWRIGREMRQTLRRSADEMAATAAPLPPAEIAEGGRFSALARRRQFHLSRLSRILSFRPARAGAAAARHPGRGGLCGVRRLARPRRAAGGRAANSSAAANC